MKDELHSGEYVSLRDYFERLLDERDRVFKMQIESSQLALDKAERTLNKRLEGMNEFRDTLRDQASKFVTQNELDAKLDATDVRLKLLETQRANLEGRFWAIGAAIVVINLGISIASFLWGR